MIGKIIVVEGVDKSGKSTFISKFINAYNSFPGLSSQPLLDIAFPNKDLPIGIAIRNELSNPNLENVYNNTFGFLTDMSTFWTKEMYEMYKNKTTNTNQIFKVASQDTIRNYIFDRYFISTLAYQVFLKNDKTELDIFQQLLQNNKTILLPTDIIFLDLPNDKIIERTKSDELLGLNDSNDTLDENIINQRKIAYKMAIDYAKKLNINIHFIDDTSKYDMDDVSKILIGTIFK